MKEFSKSVWQENAEYVRDAYGCHVDWDEGFYICPCCGEPIYQSDWTDDDLVEVFCPVCDDADLEME